MSYSRGSGPGGYYRPSLLGGFRFFPPVIKWLLISNTALLFLVNFLLVPFTVGGIPIGGGNGLLTYFLALWPLGTNFWPWQLFTYMFLHGGIGHLFFNMLALWMFGMELENVWGSRKFLVFYLLCGLSGGLANLLVAPLIGQAAPTVGASGAVFGVLIAFGMMFPNRPIYLYFLLPVRAKYLIAVWIGIELFYGVAGTSDGVAHFAHLGGAAVGFLYMLGELNIVPFRSWWQRLRSQYPNPFATGTKGIDSDGIREARFYDIDSGKPVDRYRPGNQEVIDAILDKISTGGYQSLTDEEKRILNEASKHIH
jgi:rhomboid family protein